jgi:hypothetical protein
MSLITCLNLNVLTTLPHLPPPPPPTLTIFSRAALSYPPNLWLNPYSLANLWRCWLVPRSCGLFCRCLPLLPSLWLSEQIGDSYDSTDISHDLFVLRLKDALNDGGRSKQIKAPIPTCNVDYKQDCHFDTWQNVLIRILGCNFVCFDWRIRVNYLEYIFV